MRHGNDQIHSLAIASGEFPSDGAGRFRHRGLLQHVSTANHHLHGEMCADSPPGQPSTWSPSWLRTARIGRNAAAKYVFELSTFCALG
jgi:hypothetical protein